jgi:hypothetical protein
MTETLAEKTCTPCRGGIDRRGQLEQLIQFFSGEAERHVLRPDGTETGWPGPSGSCINHVLPNMRGKAVVHLARVLLISQEIRAKELLLVQKPPCEPAEEQRRKEEPAP